MILAACKQSGRVSIPTFNSGIEFSQIAPQSFPKEITVFMTLPGNETTINNVIKDSRQLNLQNYSTINIIIGPEGGFSKKEINYAKEKNWVFASFFENVLRSETAAIATVSIMISSIYSL